MTYTKKGDNMETELFGGQKIFKSSQRIETYGTVDELNSAVGLAVAQLKHDDVKQELLKIQNHLHIICAEIANPGDDRPNSLKEDHVKFLEGLFDKYDKEIEPLNKFILPGGTVDGSKVHYLRTVSRRTEREIVRLSTMSTVNPEILKYINRLSDLFFVVARVLNRRDGYVEKNPEY